MIFRLIDTLESMEIIERLPYTPTEKKRIGKTTRAEAVKEGRDRKRWWKDETDDAAETTRTAVKSRWIVDC